MSKRVLIMLFAAVAAVGIGLVGLLKLLQPAHQFSGIVNQPPGPAADFTLTDETGAPFRLSDLRGQWILLDYGYTSCPDVCPTTLAMLRQMRLQLGAEADKVRIVFVSVDPERDTPEKLGQYLNHFGDDLKGLSGTPAQVAEAAQPYGVKYEKKEADSALGYLVSHTAFVYLIDPQFQLRVTYPFGISASDMAADLAYLFSQPVPTGS